MTNAKRNRKLFINTFFVFSSSLLVYFLSSKFSILEKFVTFSHSHETWELDKIMVVSLFLMICFAVFSFRLWRESSPKTTLLEGQTRQLQQSLKENSDLNQHILKAKEEWEKTFDAMADIVTIQDKDMRIVRANKAAHQLFQVSLGELSGKHCYEFFTDKSEPCSGCPLIETLQSEESHSAIMTHEKSGKTFQVSSSVINTENGEFQYLIHVAKDITEQKQAEEEVVLFHELVNQSNDAIYVVDPRTSHYLYANQKGYENLGYTEEELLQLGLCDIDRSLNSEVSCKTRIAQIKEHGTRIFETEQRKKYGSNLPVEVSVTFVQHQERQYLVSVARDISERKITEEELFQEKNKLKAVVSALGDGLTLQDINFKILYQNAIHKKKQGDHQGEYCYKAYHGRDHICPECQLEKCFRDGKIHQREISATTDNGTIFLEVSASPLKDGSGGIIGGIETVRDITQRKNLEIQVQQSQKMEAIGTLAGGIAHDFNNILAAMLGYAEFIQQDVPPESRIGRDINEVVKAGGRAVELVKQILTLSRQSVTEKQPLHPHLIIKEAMKMLHATLPASITIEENIDPDCGMIFADATNIHQVMINLCTNALHAMTDEKGTVGISLQRRELNAADGSGESPLAPGSFVVLTVSDTGCGMDKTIMDRIFEPYFTTKEVGKGTGLGLAVIQGIVQDCGGHIRVQSTLGKGTTFHVYFPVMQEGDKTPAHVETNKPLQTGTERILIVDDESTIVAQQEAILSHLGYTVTAKTSSEEALAAFKNNPDDFDLLLTDQTMPELTGGNLAREVLSRRPDMPIILCTGYSATLSKEGAREIGIKKYLNKPVTLEELARSVRSVLDKK